MKYYAVFVFAICALFVDAQDVVLLHTNDIHSHLYGFSPETEYTPLVKDNDQTKGGFARIAGYVNAQKEEYGDKLLVVDAGDFLMGTLFQTLEMSKGFQLNLMHRIGYEFMALGNHEFDFGPDVLAKIVQNNIDNGEIPTLLSSNYGGSATYPDEKLQGLFQRQVIQKYAVVEKNGISIGLFALMGTDADESIADYYGLKWENQKKIARNTAKYLKNNENVDLVIALSHSGLVKNKKGEWAGEDVEYAKAAKDIDIIISGHTHSYLPQLVNAGNAVIVQTGSHGINVGKLQISIDGDGLDVHYQLVEMNDKIDADAGVQKLIDEQIPLIEKSILDEVGVSFNQKIVETTFELALDEYNPMESNLGPFIADAIYETLAKNESTKVDVTLVATGVIRNNIVKGEHGYQNINDIFNVMPLGMGENDIPGSPLGNVHITGNELKKLLELILAVYPQKINYYLFFSGAKVEYDPDKGLFRKITSIKIGDDINGYTELDTGKKSTELVSVAANKYMISFIGKIKKMSFGLVNVVPKKASGQTIVGDDFLIDGNPEKQGLQEVKEWLSILDYIRTFEDVNNNGVPDIPPCYKTKKNPLYVTN